MTFPSILVYGPDQIQIKTKINELCQNIGNEVSPNNPDIFQFTDYTIAAVRQLKKFLSQKPFSHPNKIVIIESAESLLVESQNALLKMLEEPGENNFFILGSSHYHRLLPTVISRCHLIKLTSKVPNNFDLLRSTDNLADNLAKADGIVGDVTFFKQQLFAYHQELIQNPSPQLNQKIKTIIKCLDMLDHHVDPKSVLDFFLLS